MAKKSTEIAISIDLSGLSDGLKEMEKQCAKAQKAIASGWDDANTAIGTLTGSLASVNEAWTTWTDSSKTSADALNVMAQTGSAIGSTLVQLGTGFATSGAMAATAIPGVTGFGAALNTASGIIGMVATGINLVMTLFDAFAQGSSTSAQMISESTEILAASAEEMISTVADSSVEYLKTAGAIEGQAAKAHELSGELERLRTSGTNSSDSQQRMREITQELVTMYPELASMVNQYTGILEENGRTIDRVINAETEHAKVQAMKERGIELTKELANAEAAGFAIEEKKAKNDEIINNNKKEMEDLDKQLLNLQLIGRDATEDEMQAYMNLTNEIEKLRGEKAAAEKSTKDLTESEEEMNSVIAEATKEQEMYKEAINAQANEMIKSYQDRIAAGEELTNTEIENMREVIAAGASLNDNQKKFADEQVVLLGDRLVAEDKYVQKIREGKEVLAGVDEEQLERKKALGEELSAVEQAQLDAWNEREQEALDKYQQTLDSRIAAVTSTNEKIKLENETSLEDAVNNMKENAKIVSEYEANMAFLREEATKSGNENLLIALDQLGDYNAESMKILSDMVNGWGDSGNKMAFEYADNLINGMNAKLPNVKENANKTGAAIDDSVGMTLATSQVATTAAAQEIHDISATMEQAVCDIDFTTVGQGIIDEITNGLIFAKWRLYDQADEIVSTLKGKLRINGKVSVSGNGVNSKVSIDWYDKGGYFNSPQIIGIAERRPEFVGAADDLESFIGKAVNNAFVRIDPALLHDIGSIGGNEAYSGDSVDFHPQITINTQKLTDAEMKRATDYISREFAKTVTGRKVGRLQ